jgi:hypothetical protein
METTTKGAEMFGETIEARIWDSEKRNSPYSTVTDNDDTYCEVCDKDVDYSDGSKYGKCGCEG